VNAVLGYEYKGFMCRITANYQSNAIKSIGRKDEGKADRYTKSAFRLDFSAKLDLGKRVSLTMNIANLTSEREREYLYEPFWIRQDFHYGMTSEVGIRVRL
jgi:outer membrane receptor protein involved in Fe transport